MGPLNFTHVRATTFTLTLVPSHSPNENIRPDKSEISRKQSQPVCTRSPKESRLFFLNSLSWGVSTFCIFRSQVFEGLEKHWGSFCGLKEKLSAAKTFPERVCYLDSQLMELLMFALSEEGPPAWMRQIVSHLVGDRWAYGTCWPHPISSSPPAVRYCHAVMLKGPKHVLFPFSKLHQMMQICLLHFWQIGETFFDILHNKYATIWKEALYHMLFLTKLKRKMKGNIVLFFWSAGVLFCGCVESCVLYPTRK